MHVYIVTKNSILKIILCIIWEVFKKHVCCNTNEFCSVSRCVFELEMEGVKQSAVRDGIREQCAQLQLQAREGQDAIRTLQTQWQSVMDFRQLVVCNCIYY